MITEILPWLTSGIFIAAWLLLIAAFMRTMFFRRHNIVAWVESHDVWAFIAPISVIWWIAAADFEFAPAVSFLGVSGAGFAIGAIGGFLFTSYDEEAQSVGRVRDWLLGGLAGITAVEVLAGANRLLAFINALAGNPDATGLGHVIAMLMTYSALGFFVIFMTRELHWNVLLADRRANRRRIEAASNRINDKVQEKVRETISRAENDPTDRPKPIDADSQIALRQFVHEIERAPISADELDPKTAFNAAYSYYATGQPRQAITILRGLLDQGVVRKDIVLHLAYSYADAGEHARAEEVIAEHSHLFGPGWLKLRGYFLLWLPDRLHDSIRMTREYLDHRPHDGGAWLNLACAHAQLYGRDGLEQDVRSALESLSKALEREPSLRSLARTLSENADGDFYALRNDSKFKSILELASDI